MQPLEHHPKKRDVRKLVIDRTCELIEAEDLRGVISCATLPGEEFFFEKALYKAVASTYPGVGLRFSCAEQDKDRFATAKENCPAYCNLYNGRLEVLPWVEPYRLVWGDFCGCPTRTNIDKCVGLAKQASAPVFMAMTFLGYRWATNPRYLANHLGVKGVDMCDMVQRLVRRSADDVPCYELGIHTYIAGTSDTSKMHLFGFQIGGSRRVITPLVDDVLSRWEVAEHI